MNEKPILFNTEMVKAILEGKKTQTRRLVKVTNPDEWQPENNCREREFGASIPCFLMRKVAVEECGIHYPKYDVGDVLWVREAIKCGLWNDAPSIAYAADNDFCWDITKPCEWVWKRKALPSMFMPRGTARIFLKVKNVRVERLQEIAEEDAKAEGFESIGAFRETFDNLLMKSDGSDWYTNPWVWVIEFERLLTK